MVGKPPTIFMELIFMRDKFSTLDIVKALSVHRERLRDWMNNGFVVPTIRSEGQGTKAVFTREDIYLVALFVDFLKKGFKRDRASDLIRKASEILKKNGSKNLAYIIIYFLNNQNNAILAEPIYDPVTRWDKIDLRWAGRIPSEVIEESKENAQGLKNLLTEEAIQKLPSTQEWENIHLVNFKNLKKKVDLYLSLFG
jgi:DNA-binding transcriptional MerR regulator